MAHPRSRGENERPRLITWPGPGSSPLTRGKRHPRIRLGLPTGLIPAHAGKTAQDRVKVEANGAHPRSRGENDEFVEGGACGEGSSPLTRGKQRPPVCRVGCVGLIPAHAGKTAYPCIRWMSRRAHPRSRGENVTPGTRLVSVEGSSPLTRGKHALDAGVGFGGGLIPAHAGKTSVASYSSPQAWAHPRSRGENPRRNLQRHNDRGSSPLTRGKLGRDNEVADRLGLIPAHAGKTRKHMRRNITRPAHPRSRGENPRRDLQRYNDGGSSPLTRGKH